MKKVQPTWIYLIGILVFFGILIFFAKDIFIPRIFNKVTVDKYILLQKPTKNYIEANKDYQAAFTTSEGGFTVDLFEASAPKNVNNFIYLSNQGYYNGIYFHRLIPKLLIQGGDRNTLTEDPNDDGFGKTPYFIEDEVNWSSLGLNEDRINALKSKGYSENTNLKSMPIEKYSLVMANNAPNTNSSQFFIVLAESNDSRLKELNGQYTVIGKVISGTDIVDKFNTISVDNPESNSAKPLIKIQLTAVKITTK